MRDVMPAKRHRGGYLTWRNGLKVWVWERDSASAPLHDGMVFVVCLVFILWHVLSCLVLSCLQLFCLVPSRLSCISSCLYSYVLPALSVWCLVLSYKVSCAICFLVLQDFESSNPTLFSIGSHGWFIWVLCNHSLVLSCPILPCLALPCLALPCPVSSRPVLSCYSVFYSLALSSLLFSCLFFSSSSYLVLPCLALLVLFFLILPCLFFFVPFDACDIVLTFCVVRSDQSTYISRQDIVSRHYFKWPYP